jgi:hypothetical protein
MAAACAAASWHPVVVLTGCIWLVGTPCGVAAACVAPPSDAGLVFVIMHCQVRQHALDEYGRVIVETSHFSLGWCAPPVMLGAKDWRPCPDS